MESYKAGETIKEASQTKYKTYKWKIGAFFTGIGTAVGAFFGSVPGAAAGGVGGAVVGAGMGKGIEKGGQKRLDKIEFKQPGEERKESDS